MSEKLINLHLEANGLILQQIGNLIETKNIADNFDTTLSAPFDRALAPIHPNSPHLLLFMLFGSILGAFSAFCYRLICSIATGIVVTKENLVACGQKVAGEISNSSLAFSKINIDILRRLLSYFHLVEAQKKTLLLMLGNGIDYSLDLAELISKRNQRVLIVPLSFDTQAHAEDLPGLLQVLENSAALPKIQSKPAYDYLSAGGITAFGNELLKSIAFNHLLMQWQKQYDWIILTSKVLPNSSEAEDLLASFENIVVTVKNETLQDLQTRYFNQNANKNKIITYIIESV